jgi:uncharacterized membrane protein YcaP (DUF421 family)
MALYQILLRVVLAYVFALLLLRLSGKRELAQATSHDLVLALILGDLFDDLFWAEVPASQFVVAAGVLVVLQVAVALGCHANQGFARLVNGAPEVVLRDGKPLQQGMRHEQLSENDLASLLRQQANLEREQWSEVRCAHIEPDGEMSVLRHEWAKEAQQQDHARLPEAKQ